VVGEHLYNRRDRAQDAELLSSHQISSDLGMPPNWFFRMGLAELQAISNVSDEDLIAIVAERAHQSPEV
jgi:hypothetical protein